MRRKTGSWTRWLRSFLARRRRPEVWGKPPLWLAALAFSLESATKVIPLPWLARRLGVSLEPQEVAEKSDAQEQEGAAQMVATLFRGWPISGPCLPRALVLGFLLRKQAPVLRIGVVRSDAQFEAHSWIEVAGKPVGESPTFTPLRRPKRAT